MDLAHDMHRKVTVAVAAFAAFLATFNETFLNIAFSPIMAEFSIGVSAVQWLATAYMLGAAIMVPVSAFAYRRIPTKPLFLVTVGLLFAGSVIGALASAFPLLLAGRIIQSLGTGLLIPVGMNITLDVAPREKLGSYMGVMGAMTTLGPSLSVIVAGVLLSLSGWRLLLWVFAGLSLALFLFGLACLNNIAKLTRPRLDWLSVTLVGLGLIGVLYGVSTLFSGRILGAAVTFILGGVLLCWFLRRQTRLEEPLINLKPLHSRPFSLGVVVNMISLIVIFAMNIVMPIFMQSALGASALSASLTLFPAILLSCLVAPWAGKIYDRRGAGSLLPLGFLLICLFALGLSLTRDAGSLLLMAVLYIPVICGSALIIGPVQSFALSRLPSEQAPHGVTVMSTGFQIAGCIGSSVFTGVYGAVLNGRLAAGGSAYTAASSGFLAVGLLAAGCAAAGLALSLYLRKFRTVDVADKPENILMQLMKKEVYVISAQDSLFRAMNTLTEKKISGAPVVDESGALVGFISDGDILRRLSRESPRFANPYALALGNSSDADFEQRLFQVMELKVAEVAMKEVVTVSVNTSLEEVCRILHENHLRKVPVMRGGRMVGMINNSNITKYAGKIYLERLAQARA